MKKRWHLCLVTLNHWFSYHKSIGQTTVPGSLLAGACMRVAAANTCKAVQLLLAGVNVPGASMARRT